MYMNWGEITRDFRVHTVKEGISNRNPQPTVNSGRISSTFGTHNVRQAPFRTLICVRGSRSLQNVLFYSWGIPPFIELLLLIVVQAFERFNIMKILLTVLK